MVYLCFFAILFTFYGLPIHILRDVVLTMKSFVKRILHFVRYRNATRDMNQRYPDATAEEIAREDVCIICREEMHPWQQPGAAANGQARRIVSERLRPKKLPCGHLLHFACLRSWLERQQNCPTCRRPVAASGGNAQGDAQAGAAPDGRGHAGVPGQQPLPGLNQPGGANGQALGQGRPRAWFLNLGPVRIGFGAGRGDIVQNLVQQMQNNGQPGHGAPAPNPNPVPPAGAAQPVGFGFGFGRRPAPAQVFPQDAQLQILQLEQQILQEINGLMATAEQLNVVRLLQGELVRLRAAQANQNQAQGTNIAGTTTHPPTTNSTPTNTANATAHTSTFTSTTAPGPAVSAPGNATPNQRQFTSLYQPVLPAGDARLPQGLTLPQGWTLVPLQRVQQTGQQTGQQTEHGTPSTNGVNPSAQPQPLPQPPSSESPSLPQLFPSSSLASSPPSQTPNTNVLNINSSSAPSISNNEISQTISPPSPSSTSPTNNENDRPLNSSTGESSNPGFSNTTRPEVTSNEPLGQGPGDAEEDHEQASSSSKGKARAATVEDDNEE